MVSTDSDLNYNFGGGGGAGAGVQTLETVKKIGATGVMVWAVLLFFAVGLCFILAFKCVGRARKKLRQQGRGGEGEGDEGGGGVEVDMDEPLKSAKPHFPNGSAHTHAKITTDL